MAVRTRRQTSDTRGDDVLVGEAALGSAAAFESLYRRHAESAWRVAYAMCGNAEDAADAVADAFVRVFQALPGGRLDDPSAFRPYLLRAARNAAVDVSRRNRRFEVVELGDALPAPASPGEDVTHAEDRALVAEAFRSLPERWRFVLWLVEVEGMPPRDVATVLHVSANNAAQLAARARAALRTRFVQAHLRGPVTDECRFCVERLGAYVTGALAPRDLAKVDQHLAGCSECRARRDQLDELGSSLRRVVLPLPLLLGSTALLRWKLAGAGGNAAADGGSVLPAATDRLSALQRPLRMVSAGLIGLGVISAVVVEAQDGPRARAGRPPVAVVETVRPQVIQERFAPASAVSEPDHTGAGNSGATGAGSAGARGTTSSGTSSGPTSGGADAGGLPDGGAPGVPTPRPKPVANVGVGTALGAVRDGVTVGVGEGSCTGVELASTTAGCTPPRPEARTAGVVVAVEGSAAGPFDGHRTVIAM